MASCPSDALRVAFDRVLGTDTSVADTEGLGAIVADTGRLRAWLDAVDIAIARRTSELAAGAANVSVIATLSDGGRRTTRAARAAADRADLCRSLPAFEAALGAGAVTAGHVDAVVNAVRHLDEADVVAVAAWADELVASASRSSVAEFSKEVRDLVRFLTTDDGEQHLDRQRRQRSMRHWIDKATGMHHLHVALDAETGQKVCTAVRGRLSTLMQRDGNAKVPLEQLRADAIVDLLTSGGPNDRGARPVPEISVLIDWTTLVDGVHASTVCETVDGIALPVSTVRRLCCEAEVLPVVLGADGEVLECGRTRRTANRAQRRALAAMYRTCGHPHCDVPFGDCRIHHVIPWEIGGLTDLDVLIPLCDRHHHMVHEGRWSLSMTPDRVITLHRPDGTHEFTGRTCDRPPRRQRWRPPHPRRTSSTPPGPPTPPRDRAAVRGQPPAADDGAERHDDAA